MAKKSSDSTKDAAAKTAPKAAVKKTAVKKTAAPKAETASKSGTPKAATKKAAPAAKTTAAPKAAAPKKAAPKKSPAIKLSDNQAAMLNKIKAAPATGYIAEKKEEKTIEALSNKKLVKKGAKDKATGKVPYSVTKAGEKHISSTAEKSTTGA